MNNNSNSKEEIYSSDESIDLSEFDSKILFTKAPIKKNRGSSFVLTFDYIKETASAKWLSRKKVNNVPIFPPHILKAVYSKFKNYNHGVVGKRLKRIIGFTKTVS